MCLADVLQYVLHKKGTYNKLQSELADRMMLVPLAMRALMQRTTSNAFQKAPSLPTMALHYAKSIARIHGFDLPWFQGPKRSGSNLSTHVHTPKVSCITTTYVHILGRSFWVL